MSYPPPLPGGPANTVIQGNPNFQYGYSPRFASPIVPPEQITHHQYPPSYEAAAPMPGTPYMHQAAYQSDNPGNYQQQSVYPENSRRDVYNSDNRPGDCPRGNKGGYGAPNQGPSHLQQAKPYEDDVETQVDTIFIQNLPPACSREQVTEVFGSIGVIKLDKRTRQPRVWIYKDKSTGQGKGEATVTYDDSESASAAIRWFDQKEVLGRTVTVTLAFRKRNANFKQRGGGRRGGRGGFDFGGYGGGAGWQRGSNDGGYSQHSDSGPMRRAGNNANRGGRPY